MSEREAVYEVIIPIPEMGLMPEDALVVDDNNVTLVRDLGPVSLTQHRGALRYLEGDPLLHARLVGGAPRIQIL